jgi:CheY-like chemotaxis protein
VRVAPDGATALHLLAEQAADVILLDMRMPGTDGWSFAAQYVQQETTRAPIIVLTAARDAAQRAHEIGAAGYLAKPFDLEALLDVVATHMG